MRIAVAMSGGVDSSTVAALLVEQGHEVIGLAMKTHADAPADAPAGAKACCTPGDMRDARRVADQLGIAFYVLNYTELFHDEIVMPFARAYAAGLTPNPCIACNEKVKFVPLLARAELLGAELLATGHYARIGQAATGERYLCRGVDRRKDQSYFLYRLTQAQLGKLCFPLGDMTKSEVRAAARRHGLAVAEKRESQEICFVGAEGYAATVERVLGGAAPARSGPIVDLEGREVGRHTGIHRYTLGQRRGLGIAAPQPLYVTHIDAATATVTVGEREALFADRVVVRDLTWIGIGIGTGIGAAPPALGQRVEVQQRYRQVATAAWVEAFDGDTLTLRCESPQPRGAPGQAAVIYDGERVVGGGTIVAVARQPAVCTPQPAALRQPSSPSSPASPLTSPLPTATATQALSPGSPLPRPTAELEAAIGWTFRDQALLRKALTHSTYANENPSEGPDYERLEFLGDAVLDLVVARLLFEKFRGASEGELSERRARVVRRETLAVLGAQLDLGSFLRLGTGQRRAGGGELSPRILADSYEALAGALYLDGGCDVVERCLGGHLAAAIEQTEELVDFKTRLQAVCHGAGQAGPEYRAVKIRGPDHARRFVCEVWIDGRCCGSGTGSSKKMAEQLCARAALASLDQGPRTKDQGPRTND